MKAEIEGRRLIECIKSSATIDGLFGRSPHNRRLKSAAERTKDKIKTVEEKLTLVESGMVVDMV